MNERANFQKNYLMRYAVLAAVCLLLASWFAYDGFIGYPSQIPIAEEYDKLSELEPEARIERWEQITADNGWDPQPPEKSAEEIKDDIIGQYFWAAINLIIGLPALFYFLKCRNSWVESTEAGLTTSWGQSVDFSKVTRLNKKKWSNKGIAIATYEDGGTSHRFIFDDFKFEREPLGKMMRRLESILPREQIVDGPTEEETDAAKLAAEEGAAAQAAADGESDAGSASDANEVSNSSESK